MLTQRIAPRDTTDCDPFRPENSLPRGVPENWFTEFGWGPDTPPRHSTIAVAIERMIRLYPNQIAVRANGAQLTYAQLGRAADQLAHHLHSHGVVRGDVVGIFLKRSIPMVVGILAAMKLGAAYAPQHIGVATDSALRHIAKVTNITVILTLSELRDQVPVSAGQILIAIDETMEDNGLVKAPVISPVTPDDNCMVLFTSGTTGTPNGVQITHRNLANILLTSPGDMGIGPGQSVGQILSIAFDMAAWEILGCLANGGTLVIRGSDIQATAEQVDVLIATPSILATIDASRCQQVKRVAVAGEPCPRPLADTWGSFCHFYNSCGPTETTIINTAIRHRPEKHDLTIGKPTPNNTVYILDDALKALPFGEKGEMWAGGDCVTAGYIANPELNADRYRPDPFRPGHKMFRTRDLGRWTETGELRHCGRVDDLVKIRGFRVELDGVSRALEATPDCAQAVTLKYDDRTLVSFVSPICTNPHEAAEVVATMLPYYCVPALVIPLDDLPKTARGKLDKRLLLEMARTELAASKAEAAQ
ncbi:AMP-binding protein [uncultured Roseobacter sp.]|uniref:AMP-binding protein n=1 Tax=uncultured Roseobacter sp. TaxID=114847 RepID=UPI002610A960|nr:AMP-binding protein [uncultured Roseobacter sp.]